MALRHTSQLLRHSSSASSVAVLRRGYLQFISKTAGLFSLCCDCTCTLPIIQEHNQSEVTASLEGATY